MHTTPPPEIRDTIEKTVGYVLKNGASFEQRLKSSNQSDKFSFLNKDDPHHLYYQWKLSGGKDEQTKPALKPVEKPQPFLFHTDLPPVSAVDLEIIKVTALYVAKNGNGYIGPLLQHQAEKQQFDFLRPTHSLHKLFQAYVRQYHTIINFFTGAPEAKTTNERITARINLPDLLFTRASLRAQYNKQSKEKASSDLKRKKDLQLHYVSIDWQDFAIAGKVSLTSIDEVTELPRALSRDELVYRSLEAKHKDVIQETKVDEKDDEEDKEEEETPNKEVAEAVPKGMKIKAAGLSRRKNKQKPGLIKCPLTGNMISEDKFDEHLKILLRDPRYQEQQNNYIKKNFTYETNLTTDQVYENIKRLAKKRSAEPTNEPTKKSNI